MTINFSLRRLLREVPSFRSFTSIELDAMLKQMVRKEYRSGDILWYAETQPNFIGIIESGEVLVEYRYHGTIYQTVKLGAGEYIEPHQLKSEKSGTTTYARAVTDGALHILQREETRKSPFARLFFKTDVRSRPLNRLQHVLSHIWWPALIASLILSLTWHDTARIFSGMLFLTSAQVAGNDQQSAQLLEYAKLLDQNAYFVYNQQGYMQFQDGDLQGAKAAFLEAVAIEKNNTPALNNLAAVNFLQGESQRAKSFQKNAVLHNPDHPVVQYNLGLLLTEEGANEEAILAFREATYIEPNWTLPHLQMGSLYLQMQDYIRAEQEAQNAIQRDQTQESAHLILAVALYNQGRYQEAQSAVEQAIQLNPQDNIARFYQAILLSKLGNIDSALVYLGELLYLSDDPQLVIRIETEMEALHRFIQDRAP